jgi:Transposase DDE domain
MNAVTFFDLMLYHSSQNQCLSLNQLTIGAQTQYEIYISKQGLDFRMNASAVEFIRNLLQKQLSSHVANSLDMGLMEHFKRVRIKDSTKFELHKQLKDYLPGFGGLASEASACLQLEFDLKSGRVMDLDLTPGNRPDSKDAREKSGDIQKNDLIIRDLGYFDLSVLSDIVKAGAYFISKLNYKTTVFEEKEGTLSHIDFGTLYHIMKQNGTTRLEKNVFIGKDDKIPVRLIIERMPDQVYEQRVRKVKSYNQKKGHRISTEYTDRARFNLFVTNIEPQILAPETISRFYKIRWQIELIFKVWKSTFGIHATRKMKLERFLCLLYSKLLLIMVNWEIIMVHRNNMYSNHGRWLSIDKCFKTLKNNVDKLRDIVKNPLFTADQLLIWSRITFGSKHWLEKRNKRINYEEIFSIYY